MVWSPIGRAISFQDELEVGKLTLNVGRKGVQWAIHYWREEGLIP
jgi:hypothetical protein